MNKRIFTLLCCCAVILGLKAQNTDYFNVGPYEVEYKNGEVRYRLKENVDLYQEFGLKKDTVTVYKNPIISAATQVNIFFYAPVTTKQGYLNSFGLESSWKKKVANNLYLNTGLSFACVISEYKTWNQDRNIAGLFGIPVSLELSSMNKISSSLYGSIGITPMIYRTIAGKKIVNNNVRYSDGETGILLAPRIDGGYMIPIGKKIIRIGLFTQYNINCVGDFGDIFDNRVNHITLGSNLGLIF